MFTDIFGIAIISTLHISFGRQTCNIVAVVIKVTVEFDQFITVNRSLILLKCFGQYISISISLINHEFVFYLKYSE